MAATGGAGAGPIQGVASVEDLITVSGPAAQASRFITVKEGDTLSSIAKAVYGDANKYIKVFEANRPLLKHPDTMYPGQVLRIVDRHQGVATVARKWWPATSGPARLPLCGARAMTACLWPLPSFLFRS